MKAASFLSMMLLVMLSGASAAGQISVGQMAPPLTFTQLLQGPSGTRTDWPSLRGKVVVLEFWATWCGACIEQIPHLNSIVRSVGSGKVQFIAVDDQSAETVQTFVARIPITGWLGIDTTGKTIHAYGAETRPRTVVVDTEGRIAAILDPAQRTGAALLNLAAGEKVRFPANRTDASRLQALRDAAELDDLAASSGNAIFDISVRRGDPEGQVSFVNDSSEPDGPVKLDAINMPLPALTSFMGLPLDRIRMNNSSPNRYSLHVAAPEGTLEQLGPAIQLAIASAANLHLVRMNAEEDVWVIRTTPHLASPLQPVAPGKGHLCMYERTTGKLILQHCSLDKVAETLEDYLTTPTPVLNETGIKGEISVILDLATPGPEALRSALEQNMGLTLIRTRRKVERITFEP